MMKMKMKMKMISSTSSFSFLLEYNDNIETMTGFISIIYGTKLYTEML